MKGETPPILQRDDRGTVAILTMNRPAKLNALSNELLAAIMEMLDSIELDAAVRVVVITGAGRASRRTSRSRLTRRPSAKPRSTSGSYQPSEERSAFLATLAGRPPSS